MLSDFVRKVCHPHLVSQEHTKTYFSLVLQCHMTMFPSLDGTLQDITRSKRSKDPIEQVFQDAFIW